MRTKAMMPEVIRTTAKPSGGRRKDEGGRRYASRIVKQEARGKKQEICFEYKWIGI